VRCAAGAGVSAVVTWYCFAHVLLIPDTVIGTVSVLCWVLAPGRVVLDPAGGEVTVTIAFWPRRVPLARVTSVDEVLRLGAKISFAGRRGAEWGYGFTPFRRRGWLERRLRVRTGFEGMELAITEAIAAGRGAGPDPGGPSAVTAPSAHGFLGAGLAAGLGVLALVLAVLARPQADGWLVHAAALVVRAWFGMWGVALVLAGGALLVVAWRARRLAPGV
jgi:hypothetical protein